MTKLLDTVIADVRALPEDEQERAAQALLLFLREREEHASDA